MRTARGASLAGLLLLPLAAAVSWQRVEQAPKIEPDLQEALAAAKPGDRIPIFVLLSEQLPLEEVKRHAASRRKSEHRAHTIRELKDLARARQGDLLAEMHGTEPHASFEIIKSFWVVNAVQAKARPDRIHALARMPLVARLYLRTEKPDQILIRDGRKSRVYPQPVSLPEIPAFSRPETRVPWNLKRIGAERAWKEMGITGKGVVIAVMDSGMNYRHPDIRNRLWLNSREIANNDLDDDSNGYVDDLFGYNFANQNPNISDDFFHGTICGAVIAGDGTSGIVTGVAPEAKLMILRMYDQTANFNTRWMWQFYQFDAWEAFQYALENGADAVNMSYDWQPSEKPLYAAWRHVLENVTGAGVTLVAGAGNSRPYLPVPVQLTPPASIPAVISVAGTLEDDSILHLSSRGPVAWTSFPPFSDFPYPPGLPKPDVAAPVSVGDFPLVMFSGTGYVVAQKGAGTSTACPHGSGAVALLLEQNPELYPWQIAERLKQSARDLGSPGWDPHFGAGLIDVVAALRFDKAPRIRCRETCGETSRLDAAGNLRLSLINEGADGASLEIRLTPRHPAGEAMTQAIRDWKSGAARTLSFALGKLLRGYSGTAHVQLVVSEGAQTLLDRVERVEVGSPKLLLIDDDGGAGFERFYESALRDLGIPFGYQSVRDRAIEPSRVQNRETVVWITGEENRATLTPEDCRILDQYLSSGGKLLLIGQHVARDLKDSPFLSSRLHAAYAGEGTGFQRLLITRGGETVALAAAPEPWSHDQIKPAEGGREILGYSPPEKFSGAVSVGQPYRIVFASLGLEAVETDKRALLLQYLLQQW